MSRQQQENPEIRSAVQTGTRSSQMPLPWTTFFHTKALSVLVALPSTQGQNAAEAALSPWPLIAGSSQRHMLVRSFQLICQPAFTKAGLKLKLTGNLTKSFTPKCIERAYGTNFLLWDTAKSPLFAVTTSRSEEASNARGMGAFAHAFFGFDEGDRKRRVHDCPSVLSDT